MTTTAILSDSNGMGIVHYPEQARELASLSTYDIICCGHSKRHGIEFFQGALLINPGQLLREAEEAGFNVLDLAERKIQRIRIRQCIFDRKIPVHPETVTFL